MAGSRGFPAALLAIPFAVVLGVAVFLAYRLATGGVGAVVSSLPLALALLYIAGVLGAYGVYVVLRRHAEHERKMIGLYRVIADYLGSLGLRDIEVVELQRIVGRLRPTSGDGEPLRDALLVALFPPSIFYMLYRYNRLLYEHETASLEVLSRLAAIAEKHGVNVDIDTRRLVAERGPGAAAAAAATGGLLAILWAARLAREAAGAMERNSRVEGVIARMLESLRVERPELLRAPGGGGAVAQLRRR
ncbi:MAG: hypothetical protein GXO15_04350 [Crenarchaeota archaeon]|nr:hypothetical protein [Thermoproteota archaeon]